MEIFSPLLLMTLLVWGWSRSVEEYHDAEIFANHTVPISFMLKENVFSSSRSLLQLCPPSVLAQQVSPPKSLFLGALALARFLGKPFGLKQQPSMCSSLEYWE
jgi:hypothetical protein